MNLYLRNQALFGYETAIHDRIIVAKNEQEPMLFIYPNEEELRKRVSFSVDQKSWSKSICLADVGSRHVLQLQDSYSDLVKNLTIDQYWKWYLFEHNCSGNSKQIHGTQQYPLRFRSDVYTVLP